MKSLMVVLCLASLTVARVRACDLCAIYAAEQAKESKPGWSAGVFEQYTYFGTLQEDGDKVSNPANQKLDSSITQLVLGYQFNTRVGLQCNVPLIYRSFRRPEGASIKNGSESGIGDVSLVAQVQLFEHLTEDTALTMIVLGGVKFPTGDSDRLKEEEHDETPPPPGVPESAVHGHDLALGSGSFDGIVGGSVFGRWQRMYVTGSVQYAIRTEGDFHYQFANDLIWSGGPGVFVVLTPTGTVGLQFNVAGESKGNDQNHGEDTNDSGITSVFVGPAASATWRDQLSADVAVDIPVLENNTSLQIVPDYRLRVGMTWRF